MGLHWHPLIRLKADRYAATVAPSAGARLAQLAWHGPRGTTDLVVPAEFHRFEPDQWPKAGAFPMLPYANRLRDGELLWQGRRQALRVAPGHQHGVHGLGHRRAWCVESSSERHVSMLLTHARGDAEWPWPFQARVNYELSSHGLSTTVQIRHAQAEGMPAVIGWHPYIAAGWKTERLPGAGFVHDLGPDGLRYPPTSGLSQSDFVLRDGVASTSVWTQPGSPWTLQSRSGDVLQIAFDTGHIVHHIPPDGAYECVEPVTAPPGSLSRHDVEAEVTLPPDAWRSLRCTLGVLAREAGRPRT